MPNHVTNRLLIDAAEPLKEEILDFIAGVEEILDFKSLVPMPGSLDIPEGALTRDGRNYLLAIAIPPEDRTEADNRAIQEVESLDKDRRREVIAYGRKAILNEHLYDATTFYDWRIRHWGTKWNALNPRIDDGYVWFETAWSAPYPVIEALGVRYPEARFELTYADEDYGHNCGIVECSGGKVIRDFRPEGASKEAIDIVFDLMT